MAESCAARTVAVCGVSSRTLISPSTAPRLGDAGDHRIALDDIEPPLDQNIEMSGAAALMQDLGAGGDAPPDPANAVFQDIAHVSPPKPSTRPGTRIAPGKRILRPVCSNKPAFASAI